MHAVSVLVLAVILPAASAFAVGWRNVDESAYLGGRKCSEGYLQGKVVLVCRDKTHFPRLEDVWGGFKSKPFIILGSAQSAPKGVTFPVYTDAGLAEREPPEPIYVVDETGTVRYRGADERKATEVVVIALTDMAAPKSEAQWRHFMDYEVRELPAHAVIRYDELRKTHPALAADYAERVAELMRVPGMKKLVELVRFARAAKDIRAFDPKKMRLQKSRFQSRLKDAIGRYTPLKDALSDPRLVREAKNALADLAWAKAAL